MHLFGTANRAFPHRMERIVAQLSVEADETGDAAPAEKPAPQHLPEALPRLTQRSLPNV
jgi:hypothetical protein